MVYQNVLVVDDSPTSRMIIQKCFQIAGFTGSAWTEAENGLDALSILKEKKIDLVVTDINMPKLDGLNFVKRIRLDAAMAAVEIVVISGLASGIPEAELKSLGVKGIIKKPISPAKVLEIFGAKHG